MTPNSSRDALIQALRRRTDCEARFDPYSRVLYSTDASIYEIEPIGVVFPKRAADVVAVVELASEQSVPLLPRGAGTSLAGQAVGRALVLDCSKYMNRVLEINAAEGWVWVQPGVVLDDLNGLLHPMGLMFGPDVATSSRATLGGMIGNNSAGARSLRYGKTVDHVIELEVVLANAEMVTLQEEGRGEAQTNGLGSPASPRRQSTHLQGLSEKIRLLASDLSDEIETRYPKILRRVSGYNLDEFLPGKPFNLSKMVVGSEGTLAVVTGAKLNLVPRPSQTALCVVHYASLDQALESVDAILRCPPARSGKLAAVELLDEMILHLTRGTLDYARAMTFVRGDPKALLIVEFYGESDSELSDSMDELQRHLRSEGHGTEFVKLLDPAEQAKVWKVRKAGVGLLLGVKDDRKPIAFVEDTAVPVERLPEYIRRFNEVLARHETTAGIYAHASVGCLHIRPLINLKERAEIEKMHSIAEAISDLVLEFGGAMTGEHGDGLARGGFNEKLFGSRIYQGFKEIKAAFDPGNLMNPGKIVDCPPMTENLRYQGESYQTIALDSLLDFSKEGGFARAVEMCNGNGACRKKGDGTMCPSYMVTLEETHSTRGRANALRAAISGVLPAEDLVSREMFDVMDLCLECKGCKAECPSNVDMAKLKYEFLARYHAAHGYPLRSVLFANIEGINRLGCAAAPVSNWLVNLRAVKWINQCLFGIDDRRTMPPFARPTFAEWFQHRRAKSDVRNGKAPGELQTTKRVVLFNDCFLSYNYPSIGIAAVKLLEAAGYEVILPEKKCCGRPMISKGFLSQARANAQYNIDHLNRYLDEGCVIVGCEPSCLLTFRDEYPDLVPGAAARRLAESSFLIEEFLDRVLAESPTAFPCSGGEGRRVLLHGHCHQKALVGTAPLIRVLKAAGFSVEEVNSGCCGMAGSFGFEREHYDFSIGIGSMRLFEAIRAAQDGALVVAPGMSCRQQIADGTAVTAKHPVEVLAEAVDPALLNAGDTLQ
ncbi:MAG: FAD-binding protein [Armatimonadetes bacterium]|nr:FAD-binding protein [Armatimonadota bacterium]